MYRYVLFDADNTLFDFTRAEKHAFARTMQAFSLPHGAEDHAYYHEASAGLWRLHEQGGITLDKLRVERFRLYLEHCQSTIEPFDVSEKYVQELSQAAFIIEEGLPVVQALRPHCRMAIVTNGIPIIQRTRMSLSPYNGLFDALVISGEIGLNKPDPRVIDHTLSLLGCEDKSQALMVGDSLSSDIQAAFNAGIDSCWYNPQQLSLPERAPTYTIHHLSGLLPIVLE